MTTQALLTPSDIVIQQGRNPFSRMFVLDYYDGPVSGVAQCPSGHAFQFERLTETLSRFGEPRWPVWVPNWGEAPQENETLERDVNHLQNGAKGPEWIVAWRDLEGDGLLAARRASVRLLDSPTAPDWFSVLGLAT
ncbi:MAG: hypothetical protein M3Y28_02545 [Armatimonadota bacterium]|nr:hypothetical protein [Armatimonadota bacterium]